MEVPVVNVLWDKITWIAQRDRRFRNWSQLQVETEKFISHFGATAELRVFGQWS
jgi:hypothetical protein